MRRKIYLATATALVVVGAALVASNIDSQYFLGWGENIGWLNWRDADGGADGVVMHETFLSGFIWSENVGWINLGDGTPGDGVHYANVDDTDFGVNLDGNGDLYGLAWGENIGWINFDTRSLGAERARFDPATLGFAGFAWGENVGWINLLGPRVEDCNTNSVADVWDISSGTSDDCNANLYPDECELFDLERNCNANEVPDVCELDGYAGFEYGDPISVQDTETGFGDSDLGLIDIANGSELDAAYATVRGDVLYLVLAGNLASNYDRLDVFIDSIEGEGQNRLRGDNPDVAFDGLNRMGDDGSGNGLTFDADFEPDFFLSFTGGGDPYLLHGHYAELLTQGGGVGRYLGRTAAGGDGTLSEGNNPDHIRVAIDNSNTSGVSAGTGTASGLGVETGVELAIPLGAIGDPGWVLRICAFVNRDPHDWVSNQVLGPIGGGDNLGEPRDVDFGAIPGEQFFVVDPDAGDCDGNGNPDACELNWGFADDCNHNAVLDQCDVPPIGSGPDINEDLVPDQCQVINLTQWTTHETIPDAIDEAIDNDELLAGFIRFEEDANIDFDDKAITLRCGDEIEQPDDGSIIMADRSKLEAAPGQAIALAGSLEVGVGDHADVVGDLLILYSSGHVRARAVSILDVTADSGAFLDGSTQVDPTATVAFGGDLDIGGLMTLNQGTLVSETLYSSGEVDFFDGTIQANGLTNDGTLRGYGTIFSDVANHDQVTIIGDTEVVGDYLNDADAITTIQLGTLTVIGTLTNDGVIDGEIAGGLREQAGPRASGDGLAVLGDYVAGSDASLRMVTAGFAVKIGGDFDVAIDSNGRYDMAAAELRMIGVEGTQRLELMSEDIGSTAAGLDRTQPGHYPIGTLRVGPTATTVSLVDDHDNDGLGQAACEAVYVQALIVEAGATLLTNGCRVYYVSLTLDGSVDDPNDLVAIGSVPGDSDGDGDVDLDDYAKFADCLNGPDAWPAPTPPFTPQECLDVFNFDGDFDVDLGDFAGFQEAFTG